MFVFRQDDMEIVVCGKNALVSYKNLVALINLEKSNLDEELEIFPEAFREFAKRHIINALLGQKQPQ